MRHHDERTDFTHLTGGAGMSWIHVSDRLPPYRQWVFVVQEDSTQPLTAYRHHTDHDGEHWWGQYNPSRDSNEVERVAYWCEPPELP
jgi:hypothetical protein